MRFEHPIFLWLLLVVVPVVAAFFWWSLKTRQRLMTQFIEARLLPALTAGVSVTRQKIRFALLTLAVALALVALARPQYGFSQEEIHLRGLDIVVAIDVSKSMLADDIAPNRLARAKLAALDLMQQAKADRLGLVAFAGGAFLQCPLTVDETAFRQSVEALDVNIIPQGGTAIGEAINITSTVFKEGDSHRVLVLLTDGEDNDEGAIEAAKSAAKDGLRIFTVGIGSADGAILNPNLVRDGAGNVVKSRLNEKLLQDLAAAGNGFYLPLRGAKTVDTLYERGIAPLPKADQAAKQVRRYHEQFHWPLALAIGLLFAEMFWPERATSKVQPRKLSGSSPKSKVVVAVVLAGLLLPVDVQASPRSALKDYHAKNFSAAQTEYERLIAEDKKNDTRLVFNAGAAAYGATNYDAAIAHFTVVLNARDVKLQQAAWFNLGNAHFRSGQAKLPDFEPVQTSWETAIKCFQNAVTLDKNDRDAAFNLAFAKSYLEYLKELLEAARRAREDAGEAARKRNYHRAVEILDALTQKNPVTAKQFEDFLKKLKDIDAIATPSQP
ncbi:MAG: hypothetical protein RLZZ350_1534 [Verrucomicrobiota bacterium]